MIERIHNISVAYKLVKTGTECNRVTNPEECAQAAQKLGLTVTFNNGQMDSHSATQRIPYCWYVENLKRLRYNTYVASTTACGEINAQWWCICKAPTTTTNSTTAVATTTTSSVQSTTTTTSKSTCRWSR